jgi:hypothetical protein
LWRAVGWPVSFTAFLAYFFGASLVPIGFVFAYWAYASLAMRYELKNDTLLIQLGPVQQAIPLAEVLRIVPGYTLPLPQVKGVNMWGLHIGRAAMGPEGETIIYSTHYRPEQLLYVVTAKNTFAISPQQPSRFVRALQSALPAAAGTQRYIAPVRPSLQRLNIVEQTFWRDRRGLALVLAGLGLNLLFYGFLFAVFPGLPDTMHLSFPPELAERLGPKEELLELPLIALIVLLANTVVAFLLHARERAAAHLVLMAAVGIQVLLWGASMASIV